MAQTVQIMDVAITATPSVFQTVQIMGVSITTTPSPEIAAQTFTNAAHYAYDQILITATPANSAAVPTSWTWRVVTPANTGMSGSGNSRTITLPASVDGITTVIGVTGTAGAVTGRERLFSIPTIQWSEWYVGADNAWHGVAPLNVI